MTESPHKINLHHHSHQKFNDFIKSLSQFFQRDLISIPLVKRYPHNQVYLNSGLKAATLELDTASYPNIEYIAGNRLSIYPINPSEHVNSILKHVVDDIAINPNTQQRARKQQQLQHTLTDQWSKFLQINGSDTVRLALTYLYDIMTAPSRDLLRILAENTQNKDHKSRLINLSKTDEIWEKWVCSGLRTLKSTFDEFPTCSITAKALFSELTLQQPRQYSISNIKSTKRFRTEIVVIQHRFSNMNVATSLQNIKERECERSLSQGRQAASQNTNDLNSRQMNLTMRSHPTSVRVNNNEPIQSTSSVRSLRSIVSYGVSPISNQQVRKVPTYSGPVMSKYASSATFRGLNSGRLSSLGSRISTSQSRDLDTANKTVTGKSNSNSASSDKPYEGLCSSYLLNLESNDFIICEFVENPRFTLKGNRERPIMMIGQDVGLLAFRAFWQQRGLEHDRAQMFYTLFKDLSPKKFGELQLVCLVGNRCKIEDLLKRAINYELKRKVLSKVSYLGLRQLVTLLDKAALGSVVAECTPPTNGVKNSNGRKKLARDTQVNYILERELMDLGDRISELLVDNNGCLYTCCDQQMTQAIDILIVESVARNHPSLSRDQIIILLNKWKGNSRQHAQASSSSKPLGDGKTFIYTLENPFERAQVVQEIYDQSI